MVFFRIVFHSPHTLRALSGRFFTNSATANSLLFALFFAQTQRIEHNTVQLVKGFGDDFHFLFVAQIGDIMGVRYYLKCNIKTAFI